MARMRNRLPRTRKKSQIKRQNQTLNSDIRSFPKSMKRVNLKTVQTCSEGKTKTDLMDPNDSKQGKKLTGGSKISKIWENSCSCNNWRLPGEPRSLDNLFLE